MQCKAAAEPEQELGSQVGEFRGKRLREKFFTEKHQMIDITKAAPLCGTVAVAAPMEQQ